MITGGEDAMARRRAAMCGRRDAGRAATRDAVRDARRARDA
jgi:hypothetical protein